MISDKVWLICSVHPEYGTLLLAKKDSHWESFAYPLWIREDVVRFFEKHENCWPTLPEGALPFKLVYLSEMVKEEK